ncbi:Protein of unknown function (DUF1349) [Seminavis robusta]|uniref:DUF1349 domain-containing protein n=1 Tax=Seminavis robusta TaxID=568900 RepID=A0A9N8DSE0_9STRA|nr:Protein of unknown function (DUF1349) [Seminavis robusta]|eukprot:Sro248_g098280.1 Protein of unknown function (DUF1349) (262) ;mRNA; f:22279-23064
MAIIDEKPVKFFWSHLPSHKHVKEKPGVIKLKVPPKTHVWENTEEDGSSINNSPFYFRKVRGDFEATVKVSAKMDTWLDQCGILLEEARGIYSKVSLEYHEPPGDDDDDDGALRHYACCFVHPEEFQSERSTTPYPGQFHLGDPRYSHKLVDTVSGGISSHKILWLKLARLEGYIEANYSLDGKEWHKLKAARFSEAETLRIGIFGASPGGGEGFKCSFTNWEVVEDDDFSDADDMEEVDPKDSAAPSEGPQGDSDGDFSD